MCAAVDGSGARAALAAGAGARHAGAIHVSAFSALEIAIKHQRGKLTLPRPPETWFPAALNAYGIHELPVTSLVALRAPLVKLVQGDPADRVIVATAMVEGLTIITGDAHILGCSEVTALA